MNDKYVPKYDKTKDYEKNIVVLQQRWSTLTEQVSADWLWGFEAICRLIGWENQHLFTHFAFLKLSLLLIHVHSQLYPKYCWPMLDI